MAHRKRQYGSGSLFKEGRGWAIRWREREIAPDGTINKRLRYEALGNISRAEAGEILRRRVAEAGSNAGPTRSRVTFRTLARQWQVDVLPTKYKHSTRKNHQHIMDKHLIPRFGELALSDVSTQTIQTYVTHLTKAGYAPKSIDHIHDVLSAILRSAVRWGYLHANPAQGVEMPHLKTVRPKWALTVDQATVLIAQLPWLLPRTLVGLALLSGLRRGELFALRWRDLDEPLRAVNVRTAVYEGVFDDPKTMASLRTIPLPDAALQLLLAWRIRAKKTASDELIFATVSGKPISPNNILRRWVWPACEAAGLPRVTWLTFRRTYSSWAHDKGVPAKVLAQIMGHNKVDTTINVYTQVLDGAARAAADRVGSELFRVVQIPDGSRTASH